MDSCVSETTLNAPADFTARDEFLGKNRSLRPSDRNEVGSDFGDEAEAEVCLDHVVWSNLPEELLICIFARLPVKNILQIRSLSKSWRSTITSPQFQQAFCEASLVRISVMAETYERDTIFFSQANREESYRPCYNQRFVEMLLKYPCDIAGTANGLICVIKYKEDDLFSCLSNVRVFVMNLVTGNRRELPSPRITTERPTLVQMKANVTDGYTITFIYTKDREELEVTSWQVYDSVKNVWSKDEGRAIADFKDVETFNMSYTSDLEVYYDVPATFHKETKAIRVFNLHEGDERYDSGIYPSNPNGHVHNVTGELYKLCTQEGRHGVWRLVSSSKWEMVCECPDLKGLWTCLRVMNDLVVLIIELPVPYEDDDQECCEDDDQECCEDDDQECCEDDDQECCEDDDQECCEDDDQECCEDDDQECCAHGSIVKVFHMPTKVWHSFPEDEHFTARFCYLNSIHMLDEYPFLVEIRFDSVP